MDHIRGMAEATNGMMEPDTYVELHKLAKTVRRGDILDVGVGQGATTIAYALGLRRGRVYALDQFLQQRTGPHRYSSESNPEDAVMRNVEQFRSHLREYGVADRVTEVVGTTDEAAGKVPSRSLGLLSIDVDGHIDRDLGYFYDIVLPSGYIIIDDYHDSINRHGRKLIKEFRGRQESEVRVFVNSVNWHQRRRLLGKHLLTFRLANLIVQLGAMKLDRIIGRSTAVFRKTSHERWSTFNLAHVATVESSIVDDFIERCISLGGELD